MRRQPKLLRYVIQVFWIEQNILPVDTALPALLAAELKGIVNPDRHVVVVLHNILQSVVHLFIISK